MVAVYNKELLSWYLITLKLKETVDQNISKSAPSTPNNNAPGTTIPTLTIPPYSHPEGSEPLRLTNGESRHDPEPVAYTNLNLNQESREETLLVQEEDTPIAKLEIEKDPSFEITRSPRQSLPAYIQQKLLEANDEEVRNPWSKMSIYRVPKSLRDGDEKSFVPQMVSIGPIHHGKRKLREIEQHKWRAVNRVLQRTKHEIGRYINAIRPLEEEIRSRYQGRISMRSDEFLLSLVLDGIFVLELFLGAASPEGFTELGYSPHDPVFALRGVMHTVQRDMIMLENQIPLFVLDRLLATYLGRPDQPARVARLAVCFFDPLMPTDEPLKERDRARMETSINGAFDPLSSPDLHCLDAFRRSLLRTSMSLQPQPRGIWRKWSATRRVVDKRRQQFIHCVSELREAGIRCRKRNTDRFWDINFDNNGTLQIPRILIHDGTKSLFLNLIAFEQCHMDTSTNTITSYVIFMDNLINTEEDVRYLHDRGIIEHWLGNDKEVADLFSRLCQEVVFDFNHSYLSGLSGRVNKYYNSRWSTWTATLKHTYFSNPWAILSLVAGVVLLILTFAQTFYSVYAYYRPPS